MPAQKNYSLKEAQEKAFKEVCSIYGFKKQMVDVPELKVTSKSKPLFRYFEVPEVVEARNMINRIFGVKEIERPDEMVLGYCDHPRLINKHSLVAHFILVNREVDEFNYVCTRGHEYGHLLWHIGETNPIFEQAKNPDYLRQSIYDSEDFACLCGHVAMYNSGFHHPLNWRGPKEIVYKVKKTQENFDRFFL